MKAHSWDETLGIEREGERVLDAVFGPEYIIVRATKAHQRQKVDRFFIYKRAVRVHVVDYKIDRKAGQTGNLALEETSVVRDGRVEARGWIHTTKADLIVSYVSKLDTAFVMRVADLRSRWPSILSAFPPKPTGTNGERPYQTLNCCVPIPWLRAAGLFVEERTAIGAQLRLNLRGRA